MAGWLVWVLVACGFGVGEMLTTGFFLAPFAVAGALAAATDAAVGGLAAWVVFVLASILGTATLVTPSAGGKQAVVLERIHNGEGVGCVKIDGEVWTARALDDDHQIEPGTRVEVVDIKGATALVME